jgi:hypothetical protein
MSARRIFQDHTFNRLTVLFELPKRLLPSGQSQRMFHCQCICGNLRDVSGPNLVSGQVKSCGCAKQSASKSRKRWWTKLPEYLIWCGMNRRCMNPYDGSYIWYGGRGIYVCERWRHDFVAFYTDVGQRPTPFHTIERLNNNGPYAPNNCVWATETIQARNKRNNHLLTFNGRTQSMAAWAEESGILYTTLRSRINNQWSTGDALTIPVGSIPTGPKPRKKDIPKATRPSRTQLQ